MGWGGATDVEKILDIEVAKVKKRLAAKHIEMHLGESAIEFLINKGYDPMYGARPLRRAIERKLEDALGEEILKGNISEQDSIAVSSDGDKLVFKQLAGAS